MLPHAVAEGLRSHNATSPDFNYEPTQAETIEARRRGGHEPGRV